MDNWEEVFVTKGLEEALGHVYSDLLNKHHANASHLGSSHLRQEILLLRRRVAHLNQEIKRGTVTGGEARARMNVIAEAFVAVMESRGAGGEKTRTAKGDGGGARSEINGNNNTVIQTGRDSSVNINRGE